jgi:hypothetical protein
MVLALLKHTESSGIHLSEDFFSNWLEYLHQHSPVSGPVMM